MNAPAESTTRPSPASSAARRFATAVILGTLVVLALWLTALSFVVSLLIGSGCCAVVFVASAIWDPIQVVLDSIAAVIFGVLAVIAAAFAAIFSLFGF